MHDIEEIKRKEFELGWAACYKYQQSIGAVSEEAGRYYKTPTWFAKQTGIPVIYSSTGNPFPEEKTEQPPVIMDYTRRRMGIDILIDLAPSMLTQRLTFSVADSQGAVIQSFCLDATGYMNGRFPIDPGYKEYIQKNKHR